MTEWVAFGTIRMATMRGARGPQRPETGEMRIVWGGSWLNEDPSMLRRALRQEVPDPYARGVA